MYMKNHVRAVIYLKVTFNIFLKNKCIIKKNYSFTGKAWIRSYSEKHTTKSTGLSVSLLLLGGKGFKMTQNNLEAKIFFWNYKLSKQLYLNVGAAIFDPSLRGSTGGPNVHKAECF